MVKENVDKKTAEEIKQQLEGGLPVLSSIWMSYIDPVVLVGAVVALE